MGDAEVMRETVFKESIPRNVYIKASDLKEHGYTSGCPGCVSIIRGRARQAHSKACRERLEQLLKDTARFKAAEERINKYCAERIEQDEGGEEEAAQNRAREE